MFIKSKNLINIRFLTNLFNKGTKGNLENNSINFLLRDFFQSDNFLPLISQLNSFKVPDNILIGILKNNGCLLII